MTLFAYITFDVETDAEDIPLMTEDAINDAINDAEELLEIRLEPLGLTVKARE